MFSRTGTRSDSGMGRLWLQTLSPMQAPSSADAAIEIGGQRPVGGQALDHPDVTDRLGGG